MYEGKSSVLFLLSYIKRKNIYGGGVYEQHKLIKRALDQWHRIDNVQQCRSNVNWPVVIMPGWIFSASRKADYFCRKTGDQHK